MSRKLSDFERIQAAEDLKKLFGLPPYNEPANILYGDVYFAKSLEEKYGTSVDELARCLGLARRLQG